MGKSDCNPEDPVVVVLRNGYLLVLSFTSYHRYYLWSSAFLPVHAIVLLMYTVNIVRRINSQIDFNWNPADSKGNM